MTKNFLRRKRGFFLILFFSFLRKSLVSADLVDPLYPIQHCFPTEIEKECSYYLKELLGAVVRTDCDKYENNPYCRLLVGSGHTLGGRKRF